jgi:prophage maintenance system killer protein
MRYLDLEFCRSVVFPFIHRNLTAHEPAPMYEQEQRLTFIRDDQFYPTPEEKAAYLICGIASAQYFSNGNKRHPSVAPRGFPGARRSRLPQ